MEYPIFQKLHERRQHGSRGDSFCKNDLFSGARQLFFVGKAITGSTFNPEAHMIRFVGSPVVFTSRGGGWTGAVKLEMIRFVKIAIFSEVQ